MNVAAVRLIRLACWPYLPLTRRDDSA